MGSYLNCRGNILILFLASEGDSWEGGEGVQSKDSAGERCIETEG